VRLFFLHHFSVTKNTSTTYKQCQLVKRIIIFFTFILLNRSLSLNTYTE